MRKFSDKRNILIVPAITNTTIFLLLSILHFYWALGGKLWYEAVLPTNSKGTNRLNPGIAASFIIAIGLLLLACITAGNQGLFDKYVNRKYFRYSALAITLIFLLRAIGDFRFVGFLRR